MNPETTPAGPVQRRKRSFVDNRLQGDLLRRMLLHWGAFMLASTCALAIWIRMFEQPDAPWSDVLRECVYRYAPFFLMAAILLPAFVIDSIKLTSRFAGPLYRLAGALDLASRSQPINPLKFRKDDFLHALAEDLNAVLREKLLLQNKDGNSPENRGGES